MDGRELHVVNRRFFSLGVRYDKRADIHEAFLSFVDLLAIAALVLDDGPVPRMRSRWVRKCRSE